MKYFGIRITVSRTLSWKTKARFPVMRMWLALSLILRLAHVLTLPEASSWCNPVSKARCALRLRELPEILRRSAARWMAWVVSSTIMVLVD